MLLLPITSIYQTEEAHVCTYPDKAWVISLKLFVLLSPPANLEKSWPFYGALCPVPRKTLQCQSLQSKTLQCSMSVNYRMSRLIRILSDAALWVLGCNSASYDVKIRACWFHYKDTGSFYLVLFVCLFVLGKEAASGNLFIQGLG